MNVLTKEDAKAAIKRLEPLVTVRPTSSLLGELAACYFTLDDPEKALPYALLAWDKNKNSGIGMNLALILKDLGRHEESAQIVEQAYWLNSDDWYVRMGYGEALLKAGLWKQAWPIYDNARPTQQGAAADLQIPATVKEWGGNPLPDKHSLLVINEGGTGDRLSYPRFLSRLTERGINWKFYPYGELYSLFARVLPPERLVKDEDFIDDPTHWTTTFSLPAKLNIGPNEIPPPIKFTLLPEKLEEWRLNRPDNIPMIGICWKAAEMFQGGRTVRSLSEGQMMRLVVSTAHKIHWVNLQHETKAPYPVINFPRPFKSWEDTLAVVSQLDSVVTVDTSIMHLAGALGKPMATLLSGNSCWKFLKSGKKCVWYPTSTLYRNVGLGMENAVNGVIASLRSGNLT